ncbi:hypothetical protein [Sorangium sp. So ce131]|uniref:hypothetical protein n=1 Tax=Sorangium sp. So ce131 TaxID=3133282 RepID=UPI003F636846
MSHPMSDEAGGAQGGGLSHATSENDVGPDPVIGAGIALLGIFLMGVGGAQGAHYLFNFGVLVAVLGAVLFVLFVAVTALKQRRALSASSRTSSPDTGAAEQRDARD